MRQGESPSLPQHARARPLGSTTRTSLLALSALARDTGRCLPEHTPPLVCIKGGWRGDERPPLQPSRTGSYCRRCENATSPTRREVRNSLQPEGNSSNGRLRVDTVPGGRVVSPDTSDLAFYSISCPKSRRRNPPVVGGLDADPAPTGT